MEGQYFIFWNWAVVIYLFVAGVSAGAVAISALAYLMDREKYEKIARLGALIAPLPLHLGLLALIYDLERPALFWKLLTTWQGDSIMSLGAWLLLVFSFLSLLYFYLWLPERWDLADLPGALARRFPKVSLFAQVAQSSLAARLSRPNLEFLRYWTALAGIPLAALVGIYTGLLLGVLTARPFWNNPMLPMLFLLSALKTGSAAIGLAGIFTFRNDSLSQKDANHARLMINSLDLVLAFFTLIAAFLFVFGLLVTPSVAGAPAALILGGDFTLPFWVIAVAVGMVIPLTVAIWELILHQAGPRPPGPYQPWVSGLVAASVLVGAVSLRYVVVYAGQTPIPL
jgi:formate-dependent nitrite reductase membrane component NrfD